jgi:hypothetical protein
LTWRSGKIPNKGGKNCLTQSCHTTKDAELKIHFKHINLPLWQNAPIKKIFQKITGSYTFKKPEKSRVTLFRCIFLLRKVEIFEIILRLFIGINPMGWRRNKLDRYVLDDFCARWPIPNRSKPFFLQFSLFFHEIKQISTILMCNIDPPYYMKMERLKLQQPE